MSTRVLASQKLDAVSSKEPDGASPQSDQEQVHVRRRRHTPEHDQDRFLRLLSRLLVVLGALMVIWLLMRALGWV